MAIEKLDFQKVTKEQSPYTVLLNSVIQNINNADALAVYVYLYSLPPDWEINKEHIKNKFSLSDKSIKYIFSYLNRSNLSMHIPIKNEKHQIIRHDINLLNGEKFDPNEPFRVNKKATGVKSDPVEKPQGSISTRVESHRGGLEALQKKENYKRKKQEQKKEGDPPPITEFIPSAKALELCQSKSLDPNVTLAKFVTYHLGRGLETKLKDLDAAFYHWVLSEKTYGVTK